MMLAQLYPPGENDPYLHPNEVAQRISDHFQHSLVDWDRGNEKLQAELQRLEQAGAPEPIIAGHKNLFDNTVHIEVRPSSSSDSGVWFFACIDSAINVETIEPDDGEKAVQVRQLVAEIAKCLNYDVVLQV